MFDLNREINRWKSAFVGSKTCTKDELDELESHLREEIAALMAAGVSEQDAFARGVARLGDPAEICGEFVKNEKLLLVDSLAIGVHGVCVAAVGIAAVAFGLSVWRQNGDGILGVHVSWILFAYVVSLFSAFAGTYAIARAVFVRSRARAFHLRFTRDCQFLLGTTALGCITGTLLGGVWAQEHLGRFWGWHAKELGALAVVVCSCVFYWLVARYKPGVDRLGQVMLLSSMVTSVAWFGPVVWMEAVGQLVVVVFITGLMVQLGILMIPLVVARRGVADL